MNKRETEILYKRIQKQKMKMLFADVITHIVQKNIWEPAEVDAIFEQEYKKHF